MTHANYDRSINAALSFARTLADQTFARAAGAPLVPRNAIRILKDGKENYPAWLEAIASAKNTIHFETHIIHRDELGLQFAEALAEKARQGVRVRLLYDLARLVQARVGSTNLNLASWLGNWELDVAVER